jgi:hypothetical protein
MNASVRTQCWLCGSVEPLTAEHIPPRSAFNDRPVIVQRVSPDAIAAGYVAWKDEERQQQGHSLLSLCTKCNRRGGRSFVPSYKDLAHKVARQVSTRIPLKEIRVTSVRNPQLILRQVLMQFVSANGESFVNANPWIREFLLARRANPIPEDVFVYLFATQTRGFRTSGVSGHVLIEKGQYRVVSEFTHWPLGTVLSFTDLSDEPLLPITKWSEIPFNSKQTVDITLPVNPIESELPIDFRDALDIYIDMGKKASVLPDEQLVRRMTEETERRGGHSRDEAILTASPALVALHAHGLQKALDEAGRKAQERGLTPETLDSLLEDA